ncbi:MAG TPA: homoserine dehydrogenase [Longimicrobiaceae bacterium]|nr:homoserine dehydrogenase [Longimicrobiaceae bacterium]
MTDPSTLAPEDANKTLSSRGAQRPRDLHSSISGSAEILPHPSEPAPRILRIALAGCGVVGSALIHLARAQALRIQRDHGITLQFETILVRDACKIRPGDPSLEAITTDLETFLSTDADLVVEVTGNLELATRIANTALSRGLPFITANKALVAARGAELNRLARSTGARFAFEGAVAGGVPIIRALRDSFSGVTVRRIQGILNGTSNYILSEMAAGVPFARALAEARRNGFAEADPTRDLDGRDAADKIAVLAWLAFSVDPSTVSVTRRGILPDPDELVRCAGAFGATVRLVGECAQTDRGVTARVEPVALDPGSDLGQTGGVENRVMVDTLEAGSYTFTGPGAGGAETAAAVLSDILAASSMLRGETVVANGEAEDSESARWIVEIPQSPIALPDVRRLLAASSISIDEIREVDETVYLHTGRCRRECVERVIYELRNCGSAAIYLRSDL